MHLSKLKLSHPKNTTPIFTRIIYSSLKNKKRGGGKRNLQYRANILVLGFSTRSQNHVPGEKEHLNKLIQRGYPAGDRNVAVLRVAKQRCSKLFGPGRRPWLAAKTLCG